MNGAECGECGQITCICGSAKYSGVNRNARKDFEDATNELFMVLIKPKGLRQKLLRWLYPEITRVADTLRKCYWS